MVNKDPLKVNYSLKRGHSDQVNVPFYELKAENLINYSSIFYGISGTGKSFLMRDIMFNFKHYFPTVFVFCPTNNEHNDYTNLVPNALIYDTVNIEVIKEIYERSRVGASIFKNANNMEVLFRLFKMVCTTKSMNHHNTIIQTKEKAIRDIKKNYKTEEEILKNIDIVEKMADEQLRLHYKGVIRSNKDSLLLNRTLSEKEALALKYLDFNPNVLVIFDDAMTEIDQILKEGKKKGNPVIEEFFYRGRHAKITHFYSLQGDRIPPDIRKNAFNSFFTTKEAANHFFKCKANSFSPNDEKIAVAIADYLFNEENKEKQMKLVWCRTQKEKFQYIIAERHKNFKMCSNVVREFCKFVEKRDDEMDIGNPHMNTFMSYVK